MIGLLTPLPTFIVDFINLKDWLLDSFGLANDTMHVHVGLALFVGPLLCLRRWGGDFGRGPGGWWLTFSLLAALSLVAEVLDTAALVSVASPLNPWESVKDVANTLVWPLLLSLLLSWHWRRIANR